MKGKDEGRVRMVKVRWERCGNGEKGCGEIVRWRRDGRDGKG